MKLQQTMMKLSKTEKGVISKIDKLVMLWKDVGLCIHQDSYIQGLSQGLSRYTISHFNSGKLILKNIKTREQATTYMQRVHDEITEDWTFTLEEWEKVDQETKLNIKVGVDTLQQEVLQMFSVAQKREIADKIQKILRETNHPELPMGEIRFELHVNGAEAWSWAVIQNNEAIKNPGVNPWNEEQAKGV